MSKATEMREAVKENITESTNSLDCLLASLLLSVFPLPLAILDGGDHWF